MTPFPPESGSSSRRLGEILVRHGVLPPDALQGLLEREIGENVPFSRLLLDSGAVEESDLVAAAAELNGVPFFDFDEIVLDPSLVDSLPSEFALRHSAVPVDRSERGIRVAMADPTSPEAVAELESALGSPIVPGLAARSQIADLMGRIYGEPAAVADVVDLPVVHIPEDFSGSPSLHINQLLERVVDLGGSDLHVTAGIHPSVRVHGEIKPMTEFPVLDGAEIRRMIYAVLTQKQRERFESDLELDTSYSVPNVGRFRVNVFVQRNSVGAVMRVIPYEIKALDDLGLPPVLNTLSQLPRGLVLVTGPTGSGKSTTLASMVDFINSTKSVHIMTVEDPIEFLHNHKQSVVNQREVGEDTSGFTEALKHVLRQDPDVILVGEMRDLETISTALTAAETGHLVFGTLHTQDAPQSVDRVIDVFPSHQQQQIRVQLASSLQGVVTQQLVPTEDGKGRVVAVEVLVATPAVRNLIRDGKTHQIPSAMQSGAKHGMVTMDQSLAKLVLDRKITMEAAIDRCASEEELRRLIRSGGSFNA